LQNVVPFLANFVNPVNPWFERGGNWNNGVESGAFAFNNNSGGVNTNISFRVVLAPRLQRLSKSCFTITKFTDIVIVFVVEIKFLFEILQRKT